MSFEQPYARGELQYPLCLNFSSQASCCDDKLGEHWMNCWPAIWPGCRCQFWVSYHFVIWFYWTPITETFDQCLFSPFESVMGIRVIGTFGVTFTMKNISATGMRSRKMGNFVKYIVSRRALLFADNRLRQTHNGCGNCYDKRKWGSAFHFRIDPTRRIHDTNCTGKSCIHQRIYDHRWRTSKLVPLGDTIYDVHCAMTQTIDPHSQCHFSALRSAC